MGIVSLVALRLERPKDGHILINVGKWEDGKGAKPSCVLPGTKKTRVELPHEALQRILDTELAPFVSGMINVHSDVDTNVTESANYGIRTKYVRTVQYANLKPTFNTPKFVMADSSSDMQIRMMPTTVTVTRVS